MENNKIFTSGEIIDICKSFLLAQKDEDGYLSGEDILGMNNEDALGKLNSLSASDHRKFMEQVNISVQEQSKLFSSLPDEVNTEEAFQEHQSILHEINDNWTGDFEDYIIQ